MGIDLLFPLLNKPLALNPLKAKGAIAKDVDPTFPDKNLPSAEFGLGQPLS